MEGGGRAWQRGNSKNARGQSGSRPLQQPSDQDIDPMMSTLQKSHIASIVSGARASLHENLRPVTPGDLPRHLFSGDDYANRPGSSYKMKSVVGQAIDDFNSALANTTATSNNTNASGGIQMISSSKIKAVVKRSGSQNKDTNILNVLQKADLAKARANKLPALEPIQGKSLQQINKQQIKGFDSNKPIKVLQTQHSDSIVLQNQQQKEQLSGSQLPPTKKKITLKKANSKTNVDDYSEFMKEELKVEEAKRYDQKKNQNLQKLQELQKQIKTANNKRDDDEDGECEDEYEDYFESEMMKDMQGVEHYEQEIDYFEALKNIKDKVEDIDQNPNEDFEGLDDEYLMKSIAMEQAEEQQGYLGEYLEVLNEMSRLVSILTHNNNHHKEGRIKVEEDEIVELCPRIWALATEYDKQPFEVQSQCFLETILKGSFSLLAFKYPRSVIRLSACNVHLFLKIFEKYEKSQQSYQEVGQLQDFKKIFNYLFETMRGILIYAKEGQHDLLFKQENMIPQLSRVIQVCFLEKANTIVQLTSSVINKKQIVNDDLIYDLVNYTIGSIKCFTSSNVEVQKEAVKQRYIMILAKCIDKTLEFGQNTTKKSQNLVQICGAIRNLSNDDDSYNQVCTHQIIPKLLKVLEMFQSHKELMLNISRILSKVSMDNECSYSLIKTNKLNFLINLISESQQGLAFVIRISFVLANLTTYFEEARDQVSNVSSLSKILSLTNFYFQKDENPNEAEPKSEKGKRDESKLGNVEDCLVKLVRLLANLCTEEKIVIGVLKGQKSLLDDFLTGLITAIERKNLQTSEEFLLNAISCATNLLFFDTPNNKLFSDDQRVRMFHALKMNLLETQNEEVQVESVRVLSNLSRHSSLCEVFVSDKPFLETLVVVLDHTLRDLVFYSIGIVINITMHEAARPKILDKNVIPKLIEVLRDSNIEDIDLSKVAAKALHNLTSDNNYWTIDHIKKLDEILTNLGEELDSIMDVANEDEMQEIRGLRDLVNALINDMPEPMFNCSDQKCGRKFKNREELEQHYSRRHGKQLS